jgi:drug/metabolite transporter (DMT)-like permease
MVSLSGIILVDASMNKEDFSIQNSLMNLKCNFLPYMFALGGALLWSLYSNLANRMGGLSNKLTVPLLLIVSGIFLEILAVGFQEKSLWGATALVELSILAIFPCVLAYILWDAAMRRGNMILVTSFAYLSPLFSTILTSLYLGVTIVVGVWISCALVIAGAVICNFSMRKQNHEHHL